MSIYDGFNVFVFELKKLASWLNLAQKKNIFLKWGGEK